MEGDGFQIGDGFLVKFRRFQGSVDDGRAEFRHTRIGESLENDFPADAVRITCVMPILSLFSDINKILCSVFAHAIRR